MALVVIQGALIGGSDVGYPLSNQVLEDGPLELALSTSMLETEATCFICFFVCFCVGESRSADLWPSGIHFTQQLQFRSLGLLASELPPAVRKGTFMTGTYFCLVSVVPTRLQPGSLYMNYIALAS